MGGPILVSNTGSILASAEANEGSIATASALEQLNETALMKAVGIDSLTTFRALVQDVKSRGLVTVQDEDLWNTTHVLITDLGMAVLNKDIPRELQPAKA